MVELSAPLSLQTGRRSTKKTGLPRTRTVGRRFVLQPVRSRSCLLSELGEGVLRQLDNSLCPNATHNLQGLFAGQPGAASVAAPPAGIFCSQPSAVLPCLEQPCEDHSTAAATPGSSALLQCHLRLLSVQVSDRGQNSSPISGSTLRSGAAARAN